MTTADDSAAARADDNAAASPDGILARIAAATGARLRRDLRLRDLTTLRIGGRPRGVLECADAGQIAAVVGALDAAGLPLLVVAGGSNLVVADGELDLTVVRIASQGVQITRTSVDTARVRVAAGVTWDDLVAHTVAEGLGGLECLSGIPGSAGATPVQNVGAYGAEIADVLAGVELYERADGRVHRAEPEDLALVYRGSRLKHSTEAVALAVEFDLRTDGLSAPLRFGELCRRLGAEPGERRPAAAVREAVLALRRGKAMVLDPDDPDTYSAGSFFTNPVVPDADIDVVRAAIAERLGAAEATTMPAFPAPGGTKLSAGWLIERAGFAKGHPGAGAAARLSTRHALALTNRGSAGAADIVALAREVRDGVAAAFGVRLEPEPVWVGCRMD